MDSKQKIQIGDPIIITNPESPKYDQLGEYAGLADTAPSLPEKHRINFDGEIYLFHADDFVVT